MLTYNHKLLSRARQLRNNSTLTEVVVWNQIKANKLGYRFLRQKPLGNYIVDFYCAKFKLAIEIDGASHANKKEYDDFRTEYLNLIGIKVLRFSDKQINENLNCVILQISESIAKG